MKSIAISDIHQDIWRVEELLKRETYDEIVFLGDWFDTHRRRQDSRTSGFGETCDFLIWLITQHENRNKFVFLPGNHDMAYIYMNHKRPTSPDNPYYSSGGSRTKIRTFQHKFAKVGKGDDFFLKHFRPFFQTQGYTLSHAGIHPRFCINGVDTFKCHITEAWLNFRNVAHPHNNLIRDVGYSRGGDSPTGGILWLDWRDEYAPNTYVGKQIVGHTSVAEATVREFGTPTEAWDIDAGGYIVIENGNVKPKELKS